MEFFHAEIYCSGFGVVITNVEKLPNPKTGELMDIHESYAILRVSLKDFEITKLMDYLQNEFGKKIEKIEFENYMCRTFYLGSPIDSYFDLEEFVKICNELKIKPKMFFYSYQHILTLNKYS